MSHFRSFVYALKRTTMMELFCLSLAWNDYEIASTAQSAISSLVAGTHIWRSVLTGTVDADLDQIGHSQYPWGLDPKLPFLDIIWWVNQELLSHGAEIALLRDLYRAESSPGNWFRRQPT